MIQAHGICVHFIISPTSDHQVLDLKVGAPVFKNKHRDVQGPGGYGREMLSWGCDMSEPQQKFGW